MRRRAYRTSPFGLHLACLPRTSPLPSRDSRRRRGSTLREPCPPSRTPGAGRPPVPGPPDVRRSVSFTTLVRRPAALLLQAAVLLALVGATAAWSMTTKTVTVSVDGQLREVRT